MSWTLKYLDHLKLEGKAQNTLETYYYHLLEFMKWLEKESLKITNIHQTDMVKFKEFLLKSKSERTVNCIISCIKSYFDYLILNKIVEYNPVSSMLRIKLPAYRQSRLTDEQLIDFYNFIDQLQPNVRAAFYLLIGSGARVSEIAHLTKNDFQLKNDKLYINIHDAKYGSDRCIPVLHQKATNVLREYLNTIDVSSLPAFRVSKRTIQRHAANFSEFTGIPFSCHVLRHTYATLLLENGLPIEKIQRLLGHRSISITMHYTQSAFMGLDELMPTL